MRSLYVRIVMMYILIMIVSGFIALLLANVYYLQHLRDYNERETLSIGEEIRDLYEAMPTLALDSYLSRIANMGFQIYVVNEQLEGEYYGTPFKHKQFESVEIQHVLAGKTYRGMIEESQWFKVTSFFENSIRNSVGLPLNVKGSPHALFIRPNLEQQIGEVRILLAILLGFSFLFSLVLIIILTRLIVKPIKKLTAATNKIMGGDYDIQLEVARKDEIGNLARHFAYMAHSIRKLDEMRQEFVANVSHEIQSPLTSIRGFAQAILNKEATQEEEKKYVQIIDDESRRLSSLSAQLLTLATLDKEVHVLKKTSFRLDEQIRQVLIVLEWQWTEKQLTMEPILPEIIVSADQPLLYQVWFNLITNSIKFSHPGNTIRIEMMIERNIVVMVSDQGIGIADAELPHIFERFYIADKARNRSSSGSGLGLSIVKKIVELHQGQIKVASKAREGTTISITLPHM